LKELLDERRVEVLVKVLEREGFLLPRKRLYYYSIAINRGFDYL
jgi:hypothetical protein